WFYHGSPIGRKQLVRLFASILRRDENGDFWLETPAERCRIKVEDAPFLAVEINVNGSGETQDITFRTNIDEVVVAGPERPIRVATDSRSDAPAPYVLVRPGLEALITRAVYYELVELGCERHIEGETVLGVWSGGAFFPLGRL
ncbi:MAG: DUF1285 domain-containing protein, partial [Alphaproteobacteria bacterium]|nr:DUF1285 domain-containing protein [Alphaproteobacteria bacterium]